MHIYYCCVDIGMESLSDLICSARGMIPEKGTIPGTCIYCGRETPDGHEFKPTGQFTTYQLIQGGTVICPYCNVLKSSQDYRRSMWIVNRDEFIPFKQNEAKHYLQNPLDPPFAMYLTKTWKKQGWPGLVNRINTDKSFFVVGVDYELVFVDANIRDGLLDFAQELIEKGITKTEMLTGNLHAKSYEKLDYDMTVHDRIVSLAGDPLWDLCVYVTRKDYDK
jgi:CRISPR type IV-associated protein Csf1